MVMKIGIYQSREGNWKWLESRHGLVSILHWPLFYCIDPDFVSLSDNRNRKICKLDQLYLSSLQLFSDKIYVSTDSKRRANPDGVMLIHTEIQ